MIRRIYIRDYALIDELELDLGSGMNLITGETGAGKSIIVDAIGAALGERADREAVRSGCERALVEAEIVVSGSSKALKALEDAGISPEDGVVVVTRELHSSDRSQCRINGRPVTASILKSVTDFLVDTHGQHEHQYLLNSDRHLDVLDEWCGPEAFSMRREIGEGFSELCRLRRELEQLKSDARERAHMIDLYKFQVKEIEEARLRPGEEEELDADRLRLANAEKLQSNVSEGLRLLADDGKAVDSLGDSFNALQGLDRFDGNLTPLVESVQTAFYQAQEAARELRRYRDSVEADPEKLQVVQERLELIGALKKKYGDSEDEVIAYAEETKRRLDALENSEERGGELESEICRLEGELSEKAERLSVMRKSSASEFSGSIERELNDLGMNAGVFVTDFTECELGPDGIDRVEFLISANKGEPPRPLAKVASGGEISRIMLAMKSVVSRNSDVPTLIFDEIDVGVGGRTADVIGAKLSNLSEGAQVICITHLPQIARLSGEHFRIEKELVGGRTVVRVRRLDSGERVSEIARMLGGEKHTGTAMMHAKEMLGSG